MSSEPRDLDPIRFTVWTAVFVLSGAFWAVVALVAWLSLAGDPPERAQEAPGDVQAAPCSYHQLDPLKRQLWNCD